MPSIYTSTSRPPFDLATARPRGPLLRRSSRTQVEVSSARHCSNRSPLARLDKAQNAVGLHPRAQALGDLVGLGTVGRQTAERGFDDISRAATVTVIRSRSRTGGDPHPSGYTPPATIGTSSGLSPAPSHESSRTCGAASGYSSVPDRFNRAL